MQKNTECAPGSIDLASTHSLVDSPALKSISMRREIEKMK